MRRWQNLPSPKTVFSISQSAAGGCLLGTNQGLWRCVGRHCEQIAEPLKDTALTAVADGGGLLIVGASDGIAYSSDDGATWTAGALRQPAQIAQIALSPNFAVDGVGFAITTSQGVLRTSDRAQSWLNRNFGLADAEATAVALSPTFAMDGMLLVAVLSGLFASTNRGETWRLSALEREALPLAGLAFARNVVLAGSETHGLYHSTNRGSAWHKRGAFVSGPINALATSPDGSLVALATPMVVATSKDYGESWERTEGRVPRDIIALAIADDGNLLCGTQQGGLWVYGA
jgi:photosystem II stability/assembly factor-like uncharacterized protein